MALAARGQEALRKVAEATGGTVHPVDLADPAQVATLVHRVEDEAGPVDVLVNNAGVDLTKAFTETTEAELRQVTQVNYLAPAELCRQAVPRMLRRGQGHIVNVSSLSGVAAFPGMVAYSASKAALSHLTSGLRADLKGLPVGDHAGGDGADAERAPRQRAQLRADRSAPSAASTGCACSPTSTPSTSPASWWARCSSDRRHVRFPKRARPSRCSPKRRRRTVEVLLAGVPHRPKGR